MFRPFTVENAYVFRSDNVRSLFDRISEDERSLLTWNPEKFDWYDYWLNIHLPGLTKWVFPTLEDEMQAQPKRIYTYRDLLELLKRRRSVTPRESRCASNATAARAVHLRRSARAGHARRRVPRQPGHQTGRSRDAGQRQRARVGHDISAC